MLYPKAEVKTFFAEWAKDNSPAEGEEDDQFEQLKDCIDQVSEQDGEELFLHVTKDKKTDVEFNTHWTKNPTNVFGSQLYTDLCKFLGVGMRSCLGLKEYFSCLLSDSPPDPHFEWQTRAAAHAGQPQHRHRQPWRWQVRQTCIFLSSRAVHILYFGVSFTRLYNHL